MTTVADILQFLEAVAPSRLKMDWDNVGLLCGDGSAPVNKILVALDPFESICREAVDMGADLLITHHPLIFQPISTITEDTETGRSVRLLCCHGISAINAHTNLDCAAGGVNDVLAETLELTDIAVLEGGLLRCGNAPQQELPEFLAHVKAVLGCDGLRYVNCGKMVSRVAVGGGSCGSELMEAFRAGCDTFITADVKYHQFHDAAVLGLNLIDAGHFYTENPVVPVLAKKIAAAFPEIEVKISENNSDCMKYY